MMTTYTRRLSPAKKAWIIHKGNRGMPEYQTANLFFSGAGFQRSPMMQRNPTILLAGTAVRDDHPAVDPDPARCRWKQIVITVGAEPPFELTGDWH